MDVETQDLAQVQQRWDNNYAGDYATQESLCKIYTLGSPLYWELYGNQCLSNAGKEYGWISWLKRVYGNPRPKRVLELGSGNGDLSIELQRVDFADEFTGLELSDVAIQVARQKCEQLGYQNISFVQKDLNTSKLEPARHDVVVAQMCIHHVERLEWLFEQVVQTLVPGGLFVINDYVGPTRWQFTIFQLFMANFLIVLLPRYLRFSYPGGQLKRWIRRPTIQNMIKMDPSEAVRSSEIMPIFKRYFAVEHCIDYGGTISTLVLDNIIGNFRREDSRSMHWLRLILKVDHWARHVHLVPTANVVMAGRSL